MMKQQQIILKKQSWASGVVPAPLVPYSGMLRRCPTLCKGKKGQEYRECLIKCSKEIVENFKKEV